VDIQTIKEVVMARKGVLFLMLAAAVLGLCGTATAQKTITLGIYQEPENLNTYIGVQTVITYVHKPFAEYLIDVNEKGEYFPVLAAEIPTVENGGVSKDGLTITYKLRKGVKWSDGAPFTSADVKFTWEAVTNPKNLVKSKSGYDLIQSVETPDEHTAVVKYKEFYAPFLTRFSPVLPKHILGKLENINDAPYNRMPVGTGPFMVTEWASGNYIAMAKNPHYRDADKVKIDKLFFKPGGRHRPTPGRRHRRGLGPNRNTDTDDGEQPGAGPLPVNLAHLRTPDPQPQHPGGAEQRQPRFPPPDSG
jgi:ABC-type transport system substrate-binding protein